jgi:hypothetical protein
MKFCPVVPEICCGQVHASRKERIRIILIKIIIRNGAKTISKERRKRKRKRIIIIIIIIIRNGAKTISLPNLFGRLNNDR